MGPHWSHGGAFPTLDWLVEATESLLRESGGAAQSFDALPQATDDLVLGWDPNGGGTLQYKIYPWGRPGIGDDAAAFDMFPIRSPGPERHEAGAEARQSASFNICGTPGDLRADEIASSGAGIEVRGRERRRFGAPRD